MNERNSPVLSRSHPSLPENGAFFGLAYPVFLPIVKLAFSFVCCY